MTVRCNNCREWFPKDASECPSCGLERPGYNRTLHTSKLNNNLFDQVRRQQQEDLSYQSSLREEKRLAKRFGVKPASADPAPLTDGELRQLGR